MFDNLRFVTEKITLTDLFLPFPFLGFIVNGTLPPNESQGVHSLTDVPVYTKGPGGDAFRGVYDSTHIFFSMVAALGLGSTARGF